MCGGFKASRKFAIAKEDQIKREMARLGRLRTQEEYTWPTTKGLQKYIFGGYARIESIDSGVWNGKIKDHIGLEAEYFSERNTVNRTKEFVHFKMPEKKAIHAVVTNDNELRIVTQPAYGNAVKIHHRIPDFVDLEL